METFHKAPSCHPHVIPTSLCVLCNTDHHGGSCLVTGIMKCDIYLNQPGSIDYNSCIVVAFLSGIHWSCLDITCRGGEQNKMADSALPGLSAALQPRSGRLKSRHFYYKMKTDITFPYLLLAWSPNPGFVFVLRCFEQCLDLTQSSVSVIIDPAQTRVPPPSCALWSIDSGRAETPRAHAQLFISRTDTARIHAVAQFTYFLISRLNQINIVRSVQFCVTV